MNARILTLTGGLIDIDGVLVDADTGEVLVMDGVAAMTTEVAEVAYPRPLSHPAEIEMLMREAVPVRVTYWCEGCRECRAVYMPRDNHWYPARAECFACGWWQPWAEYEGISGADLGQGGAA